MLIAVGLAARPERGVLEVALLVMALGTAAAWLAASTGESAGRLAARVPGAAALERHEALGEATCTLFTALTLAYGSLIGVPLALRRAPSRALRLWLHGAFLALHVAALGLLAETAHQGGRLVHAQGGDAAPGPEPARAGASPHLVD